MKSRWSEREYMENSERAIARGRKKTKKTSHVRFIYNGS